MLSRNLFKWLHCLLTFILLVYVALNHFSSPSSFKDDRLLHKKALDEQSSLYITEYVAGGATVGPVFRYFVYTPTESDELAVLNAQTPFLVADNADAKISLSQNTLFVEFSGRVYDFHNKIFYQQEEQIVRIGIDLTATPENL